METLIVNVAGAAVPVTGLTGGLATAVDVADKWSNGNILNSTAGGGVESGVGVTNRIGPIVLKSKTIIGVLMVDCARVIDIAIFNKVVGIGSECSIRNSTIGEAGVWREVGPHIVDARAKTAIGICYSRSSGGLERAERIISR